MIVAITSLYRIDVVQEVVPIGTQLEDLFIGTKPASTPSRHQHPAGIGTQPEDLFIGTKPASAPSWH
jgi:hypothetical protein